MLEIELNRCMEKIWGELVPKLEEGGSIAVGGDTGGAAAGVMEASQPQQPTMVNLPPPLPAASSSQPTYSNIPVASDPMMESSIQYRDNTGMGL
jgi:hypothetical protein